MKISARNQIKGTVKTVKEGAVNAVVTICRGNHNPIKADITMEAVKQFGGGEGVGDNVARKIVAGDDERLSAIE